MAFVNLDSVQTFGPGTVSDAEWGQQVNDNVAAIYELFGQTWSPYDPGWASLTIGDDGRREAYYKVQGYEVHAQGAYQIGADSVVASATVELDLPTMTVEGPLIVGVATVYDASAGERHMCLAVVTAGNNDKVEFRYDGTTYGTVDHNSPFVWAAGDELTFDLRYRRSTTGDADPADPGTPVAPAAIEYVGADTDNSVFGASSLTVTIPTVLDDDVAFLFIDLRPNDELPTGGLTGWTLQDNLHPGVTGWRQATYTKILSASDSATNVTPTHSSNRDWSLSLLVLRGVDTSDPIDAASTQGLGTGTSVTFPAVTSVTNGAWAVAVAAAGAPQTGFTPPTGYTERIDNSGTNAYRNHQVSTKLLATAGAETPAGTTIPTSTEWGTHVIAVKPASGTAPPPTSTTLSISTQPVSITVPQDAPGTFTILTNGGGSPNYTYTWQGYTNSLTTWTTLQTTSKSQSNDSFTYPGNPAPGSVREIRCVVTDSLGNTVTSSTVTLTITNPTGEPDPEDPGDITPGGGATTFWKLTDYAYPTAPTNGSTVGGQLVVWVNSRATLNAALGNNKYIVLQNANYWGGSRLNIDSYTNLTLHAQNKYGATFDTGSYGTNNPLHVSRCTGFDIIGVDFIKCGYYAIRFGGNANFSTTLMGPCTDVLVEHCGFRDLSSGAIKIDNGRDGPNLSTPAYWSRNFELRYNEFTGIGKSAPSTNLSFSEGIYMGDGTYAYVNQVQEINIHHNIFDGASFAGNTGGEAIEAKIYCQDIRIAFNEFRNWQTAQNTSGGCIALLVNTGDSGNIPSAGTKGMLSYLVEGNRIYNTRTIATWSAANAIVIGHGNMTVRNNIIWGNAGAAIRFMQKNVSSNGVFSNPSQLTVNVYHNTMVGNAGGTWSVDFQSPPYTAIIQSRGNLCGNSGYPNQGVTFPTPNDFASPAASAFVSNTFSGLNDVSSGGMGSGLRPDTDGTFALSTDYGVATDIFGNPRPSGTRQYGAAEFVP